MQGIIESKGGIEGHLFVAFLEIRSHAGVANTPRGLDLMVPEVSNANKEYCFRAIIVVGLLLLGIDEFKVFWVVHPEDNRLSVVGDLPDMFIQHFPLHSFLGE